MTDVRSTPMQTEPCGGEDKRCLIADTRGEHYRCGGQCAQNHSIAFTEGWNGFIASQDNNPYPETDARHGDWEYGWSQAAEHIG